MPLLTELMIFIGSIFYNDAAPTALGFTALLLLPPVSRASPVCVFPRGWR